MSVKETPKNIKTLCKKNDVSLKLKKKSKTVKRRVCVPRKKTKNKTKNKTMRFKFGEQEEKKSIIKRINEKTKNGIKWVKENPKKATLITGAVIGGTALAFVAGPSAAAALGGLYKARQGVQIAKDLNTAAQTARSVGDSAKALALTGKAIEQTEQQISTLSKVGSALGTAATATGSLALQGVEAVNTAHEVSGKIAEIKNNMGVVSGSNNEQVSVEQFGTRLNFGNKISKERAKTILRKVYRKYCKK